LACVWCGARGWSVTEFVDHGVSGAKDRPQLDAMLAEVRRRKFDVVVITKLDRLARGPA
jgi:DNA invertase Pin-like site-specific DNA recombinase